MSRRSSPGRSSSRSPGTCSCYRSIAISAAVAIAWSSRGRGFLLANSVERLARRFDLALRDPPHGLAHARIVRRRDLVEQPARYDLAVQEIDRRRTTAFDR